ncbi:MAG: ester cyclase [Chloroflexi bacterium]|nr:ester cyclase [Chloroflexota bacterium]
MSEQNKAVVRRLVDGFWEKGDAKVMDEVFAANFIHRNPAPGAPPTREGLKQTNIMIRAAFSNGHTTVDDLVAEGDKVVWRWTFRATHTGPLMGIPATGRQITMTGIVVDRVVGGKIVERWDVSDVMGLMQQLGVIPAPGQTAR